MAHSTRPGEFDELYDIKIVEVKSPDLFYGITGDDKDEYEILDKVINDYYNNEQLTSLAPYSPKRNEICIAKRLGDKRWYRVEVHETFNTTRCGPQAQCFFVDDGHTELVPIHWLRKAAKKYLELPFRVKTFSLYGIRALTLSIQPDGSTQEVPCKVWDTSAIEYMQKIVKVNTVQKYHLKNVDSDGIHYIILHIKQKNGEELTVNDMLVNQKYAASQVSDNLPDKSDADSPKKSPMKLDRSYAETIKGYLSDKEIKRSSRLQKCVELQNRAAKSDTEISDVTCVSRTNQRAQVSPPDVTCVNKANQSTLVSPPRFGLSSRAPGSVFSNIQTPPSPAGRGFSPRLPGAVSPASGSSRMALLQNLIANVKMKNVSVSDTEAMNSRITMATQVNPNHLGNKTSLSDGDGVRGDIPKLAMSENMSYNHPLTNAVQRTSEGNISDSSVTSDSRNLLSLRGLLSNPNEPIKPQRLPKHAMTTKSSPSESSDTDNVYQPRSRLSDQLIIPPIQEDDPTYSPPDENIRPILRRTSSSGDKLSVRFSDSEADIMEKKAAKYGQLKGKKLLETLNIGCKKAKDMDQLLVAENKQVRENVLVHSSESVEPFYKMEDVPFSRLTMEVIQHIDCPAPTPIQSYVWRGIFRGSNVLGIAPPRSGKTLAYLAAVISNLLNPSTYIELPNGNGPLAIFLVPSWKKAQELYDRSKAFIRTLSKPRVLVIYGGNMEDKLAVPLINGCELLIATPPCLERMIDKRVTQLNRLCHLVIDDAEVLLQEYHQEVRELMERYRDILQEQGQRSAPQQILMFGNQWCEPVQQFTHAYMVDPVIVFTSMFEAAVYGQVKQVVTMCRSEQRSAQFVGMLDTVVTDGSRVVIFVNSVHGAIRVNELLNKNSMYAIVAHDEMDKFEIEHLRDEWYQDNSNVNDPKILVCSDKCLADLQITNATAVIHYDLAETKTIFGVRVACMRDYFWSFNQKEKKGQNQAQDGVITPTSYIMMTELCSLQARAISKLLKRLSCSVPPKLTAMIAGMSQEKEKDVSKDLCHYLKAYGECRNKSNCKSRHLILPDKVNPSHTILPKSGEVKVLVTHVENASHFYVRLLEHRSPDGTTDMSAAYLDLLSGMAVWYGNLQNRVRQTQLCPGELCALEDNDVFYRVKIIDIDGTNTLGLGEEMRAKVWLVDEGRQQKVVTHRLHVLPRQFFTLPYQAVDVYVCRVKPIDRDDDWTSNACMYMHELLNQKVLEGRIVLSYDDTLWLDPLVERVHLHAAKTVINNLYVRSELLKNNFAVDNPKHLQKLYELCKGKVEIPDVNRNITDEDTGVNTEVLPEAKEFHDVYLHEMELPDLMFLHKKETNKQLEEMMSKLADRLNNADFSKSESFLQTLDVGTVCLARCTKDDSWNRAKVMDVLDDGTVEVFYTDYGDKDVVEKDRIQNLPKDFSKLPFQAIECELAHVKPRGDCWTDNSGDTLWDLSHSINGDKKILVAKIVSKTKATYAGFHKYKVELYDTSNPDVDVNLSHQMVWSGVASPEDGSHIQDLFLKPKMFGEVYISPVMKIADLCATIYWNQDESRKLNAAKEIYQIVSKSAQSSPLALIQYKGIAPIIKLIGRIINPHVHSYMLDCLTCGASASDRLSEEILNQDGALCVCKCLEQNSRPQVQEHAIRSIARFVKANTKFREAFEEDEVVFKLLCELLEAFDPLETDDTKDSILTATCNTLTTLCKGSKRSVDLVHGYKICNKIQKCLQDTKSHPVTEAIFMFLASLIEENSAHEGLRKEKLARAVVSKIDTNIHCEICVMCGLKFCDNLCEAGRKYKTKLLELGTVFTLNTILLKNFSRRTSELCRKLLDAIVIKVPSEVLTNQPTSVHSHRAVEQGISPQVHWTQNSFVVMITVKVRGVPKNPDPVKVTNTSLNFRGISDGKLYSFDYELYDKVNPDKCHIRVRSSEVIMSLCKVVKGKWPRLLKDKVKPSNLSVDFEKFVDSSSDSEVYDEDEPFKLKKVKRRQLPSNLSKPKKSNIGEAELQYRQWDRSDSDSSSAAEGYGSDKDRYDVFS